MAVRPGASEPLPLAPGIVLGVGLGGFADGIVLHQILQWHHMLTSAGYPPDSVPNLTVNVLFDGLFHAATWIGFNLMEGIVDHHLLGLHHVRAAAANPLLWDLGFLVVAALLVAGGYALARSEAPAPQVCVRRAA